MPKVKPTDTPGSLIRIMRVDFEECFKVSDSKEKAWACWETDESLPSIYDLAMIARTIQLGPYEIAAIVEASLPRLSSPNTVDEREEDS